jgi:hypothetical protein
MKATGKPLMHRWLLLPGLELSVFRLAGQIGIHYVLGDPDNEWVLQANNPREMERSRERWGLAFTYGQA